MERMEPPVCMRVPAFHTLREGMEQVWNLQLEAGAFRGHNGIAPSLRPTAAAAD